jgi:hypothetical protein
MHACSDLARPWLAAIALLLIAGCAQQSGSGQSANGDKVPSYIPADRWFASARDFSGGVAASDRNAALILACEKAGEPITLLVSPQKELPIGYAVRPVTIILDRDTTLIQNWVSLDAGYSIDSKDPDFRTVIEALQKHKEVEFILGRPGKDIDDRSFTLNGAKPAIDTVLAECKKS